MDNLDKIKNNKDIEQNNKKQEKKLDQAETNYEHQEPLDNLAQETKNIYSDSSYEKLSNYYKNNFGRILFNKVLKILNIFILRYGFDLKQLEKQKLNLDFKYNLQDLDLNITSNFSQIVNNKSASYKLFHTYIDHIINLSNIDKKTNAINISELLTILLCPKIYYLNLRSNKDKANLLNLILNQNNQNNLNNLNRSKAIFIILISKDNLLELNLELLNSELISNFVFFIKDNINFNLEINKNIANSKIVSSLRIFSGENSKIKINNNILSSSEFIFSNNYILSKGSVINSQNRFVLLDFANGSSQINQIHTDNSAQSFIKIKALSSSSKLITKGHIIIDKSGKNSIAEQKHESLLLDAKAFVLCQPSLEVKTGQVQCKHGSAVSKISQENIWFLESRGFSNASAKKLLLKSFLEIKDNSSKLIRALELI